MPRPVPEPEDEKIRTTVSLPKKVFALAERYRELHPEEDLRDFSAVVSRSLIDYAARKHPDLLADIIRNIRNSKGEDTVEEPAAKKYGTKIPPKPEIHAPGKPLPKRKTA